jgi:hypothetical protein
VLFEIRNFVPALARIVASLQAGASASVPRKLLAMHRDGSPIYIGRNVGLSKNTGHGNREARYHGVSVTSLGQ